MTEDMHKLVWAELRSKLEPFALDDKKRLAFNAPEHDVLKMFSDFMDRARKARHFEMNHIGNNPIDSIDRYEAANAIGNNLITQLDEVKAATVFRWTRIFRSTDFFIGIAASIAAYGIIKGVPYLFF